MGICRYSAGIACCHKLSRSGGGLVAPRTLQALATDESFPSNKINEWLTKNRESDGEPVNATLVTCVIAIFFVLIGDVDMVAQIISMFFLVSYGSICLISFLNHFGSSPSYRPSFKSKWFSLIGFAHLSRSCFKSGNLHFVCFSRFGVIYIYIDNP